MATFTEQLKWLVTADASQAVKQFEKVGKAATKDLGGAQKSMEKLGSSFLKFGGAATGGGFAVIGALTKTANAFKQTAGEARSFAIATGISTETSSRLIVVARNMGIEAETLQASIGKMNATAGSSPEKFAALGIAIARNKDGTEDVIGTFENMIDVLGRIKSADDRAAAAKSLLGKGYASVLKLVAKGTDEINKAMAAVDPGQVITDKEAKQAKEYSLAMKGVSNAFKSLTIEIGQGAAPILGKLATIISGGVRAFSALDDISSGFVGKVAAIGAVGLVLAGTASVVIGAVVKMGTSIANTARMLGLKASAEVVDTGATTANTGAVELNTVALEANAGAAGTAATGNEAVAVSAASAATAEGTFAAAATGLATSLVLAVGSIGLMGSEALIATGRTKDLKKGLSDLVAGTTETASIDQMTAAWQHFMQASLAGNDQFKDTAKFAAADVEGAKRLSAALHSGAIAFDLNSSFGSKYIKVLDDAIAAQDAAAASAANGTGATEDGTQATIAKVAAEEELAKALDAADKAQGKYNDAIVTHALDDETKAFEDQTKALEAHKKALEDDGKAQSAIAEAGKKSGDSAWAVHDATVAYAESLTGMGKALKDAKGNGQEINKVYEDNAKAADAMANASVENATNLYAVQGVTLKASQQTDIWNSTMLKSIGTLTGPARKAITDHIEAVNAIPEDRKTEFEALVNSGDLVGAQKLLDDAGATRTAEVQAEADAASVAQTTSDIDKAAADRDAKINVQSNAKTVQNELDLAVELRNAEIIADVDHSRADAIIAGLIKQRNLIITAQIISKGGAGYGGRTGDPEAGKSGATGGQLTAGQPVLVGDGPGGVMTPWSELFVPSTDGTLYSNANTRAIMRGALIPSHATGAGAQQLSAAQLILLENAGAKFPGEAGSSDAVAEQDRLQAAMYKTGRISLAAYRDYAKGRLAASKDLSEDWLNQYDLIESLNQKEAEGQQAMVDRQDQIQAALAETGAISQQAYEDYLKGRLNSFTAYSDDWLAVWKQIKSINEQQVADQTAEIDKVYDHFQARHDLAVAQAAEGEAVGRTQQDMETSWAVAHDRKKTPEERQAAVDQVIEDQKRVADQAYQTILAGAASEDLKVGSVPWDRYMRQVIEASATAYDNRGWQITGAAIRGHLDGIPDLAAGGVVKARPGGTVVRVGEAGQDEAIVPLGATNGVALQRVADAFADAVCSALASTSMTLVVEGTPLTAVVQQLNREAALKIKAGIR